MAKRLHYTQSEWLTLAQAPTQVAMALMGVGRTSPFQLVRELIGLGEALRETSQATSAGPLIRELNVETQAQLNEIAQQQTSTIDLSGLHEQALEICARAAALVDAKEPAAEADEYKHWVLWLGRRVAAAAGEGGAQPISIEETAMLAELADALGLRQRQVGASVADQPALELADQPAVAVAEPPALELADQPAVEAAEPPPDTRTGAIEAAPAAGAEDAVDSST